MIEQNVDKTVTQRRIESARHSESFITFSHSGHIRTFAILIQDILLAVEDKIHLAVMILIIVRARNKGRQEDNKMVQSD